MGGHGDDHEDGREQRVDDRDASEPPASQGAQRVVAQLVFVPPTVIAAIFTVGQPTPTGTL